MITNRRAGRVYAACLAIIVCTACDGGGAGASLSQLAALSAAVSEVQKALSSAVAQADDATKNRIAQLDTTAKDTIRRLDGLVTNAEHSTARQREEAARQAFDLLAASQKLVDDSGKDVFRSLNVALASVSATLDAIPFVNVPDTIFAIAPYKLRQDAADREVSIYGYFPSVASDASAVAVTLDGIKVPVKRSIGKIYFDLPAQVAQAPAATADVRIQMPRKSWYGRRPTPIDARLRFLSKTPYSFTVDAMKDNPDAMTTLSGRVHTERADSGNPSRNVHLAAEGLFNTTVGDPRYDAATAQIVNVAEQAPGHGKACEDCPDPSGSVASWNASAIELALSAPNCGSHLVNKQCDGPFGLKVPCPYNCGGGGSHYDLSLVPTFTVRVKGAPAVIALDRKTLRAGWQSVVSADLPADWTSALVTMTFDDNFDRGQAVVVVKRGEPVAASALFNARVEENRLLISTR